MRSIVESWDGLFKPTPIEIREYTHPLLIKYLPEYKFYIPYLPPYKGPDYTRAAWYVSTLGIVDEEKHLRLFDNSLRKETSPDLVQDFLKTANIRRNAPSSTGDEMKEIARMFLILSSLKGLNGWGLIHLDPNGLPAVRDLALGDFKLERKEDKVTVSCKVDNEVEKFECSILFTPEGNIIAGEIFHVSKGTAERISKGRKPVH